MILLANKHTPRSSTFLKPLQLIGLTDSAQLTPKPSWEQDARRVGALRRPERPPNLAISGIAFPLRSCCRLLRDDNKEVPYATNQKQTNGSSGDDTAGCRRITTDFI
jgi:hypothetical protein